MSKFGLIFLAAVAVSSLTLAAQSNGWPPSADRPNLSLWPGAAPGAPANLPPEADTTTAKDKLIAGRTVIRLGNISTPTLTYYAPHALGGPAPAIAPAVVVFPGGGYRILAIDLEGT